MPPQPTAAQPTASGPSPSPSKMPSFEIVTKGRKLPGRYIAYGPEKVGKTSLAAYLPGVVFAQMKGETGLETLMDAGLIPDTPHFPGEITSWPQLLNAVAWLAEADHPHKTIAVDALDGAQGLCFDHVRDTQFGGDDGKFMAYHKGYDVAPTAWKELLIAFDRLRVERNMTIFLIAHSKIAKRKNPGGEDWTYYAPGLHEKIWELTARWADAILFMEFETDVEDGKATGGKHRIIHTNNDASYVAGNRYGLTKKIVAGSSGKEACNNLLNALKAARGKKEN
jgi:hypothetical protein